MTRKPNRYYVLSLKKPKPLKPSEIEALSADQIRQALGFIGRWPDSPLKKDAKTMLASELQRARIYDAKNTL